MPKYDFLCSNRECASGVFTVFRTLKEYTGDAPCPACGQTTKHRAYDAPPVMYRARNAKEAVGFSVLEQGMKEQSALAHRIADGAYEARAKMGYEAWKKSGAEDRLYQELAEQKFKPDAPEKILTSMAGGAP